MRIKEIISNLGIFFIFLLLFSTQNFKIQTAIDEVTLLKIFFECYDLALFQN